MIQEAPDFIGDSETAAEPGLPVLLPLREQEARRCISPLPVPAPGGYPQASFFSIQSHQLDGKAPQKFLLFLADLTSLTFAGCPSTLSLGMNYRPVSWNLLPSSSI